MPLLSVITITYEDPTGLAATMRSLSALESSGLSWEHVIVDSSPRANARVLAERPTDWPLIHVAAVPEGIYQALNTGFDRANGDLVWFLNGGDRLREVEALKRVIAKMEASQLDLVCTGADLYRNGTFLYPHFPRRTFRESMLGSNAICQQGVIYRRKSIHRVGPFSTRYRIAGDYEFHLRCLIAGLDAACDYERIAEYDMDGVSSTRWPLTLAEFDQVLHDLRDQLPRSFHLQSRVRSKLEVMRITAVKTVRGSRLGPALRPVWIAWNRQKAANTSNWMQARAATHEAAAPDKQLDTEARVRAFYDNEGWSESTTGVSTDAELWEDLRPVARSYVSHCRLRICEHLPSSGDRILDAASGPIQYPEYLEYSKHFASRVCVDISERALEQAQAKLGAAGEYVKCSLLELPFPDDHFDAALSLHTIYHIERSQQATAVRELIRVTKAGKPIVIIYANPDRLISRAARLLSRAKGPTPIYYFAHPLSWWNQFKDQCSLEMFPWRSLAAQDSKRLIPNNMIGRGLLDLVERAERRFPSAATQLGAYPMIVMMPKPKSTADALHEIAQP